MISDRRIAELDGLRGLAAVAVVCAHYFGEVEHGIPGLSIGWLGVNLFFVLSGFLIGSIIMERKDSPNFFRVFYVRRAARILPIYFVTIAAALVFLTVYGTTHWSGEPLPALSYLSFTQNFVMAARNDYGAPLLLPTWTLAVEEQFYLLIPLVIVTLPARGLLPAILSGIALAVAARAVSSEVASQVLLFTRADVLLCGVLAAYAYRNIRIAQIVLRLIPLAAVAVLVVLVPFKSALLLLSPLLAGALFASYVLLAAQGWPRLAFFRAPIWKFFGTISYALYLVHQPVAVVMHGLVLGTRPDIGSPAQILVTVAAFIASITIAWLSWHMLEAPILRLGRRLTYAQASQPRLQPG